MRLLQTVTPNHEPSQTYLVAVPPKKTAEPRPVKTRLPGCEPAERQILRGSWLNKVEVWFSILQGQSLSGTSFTSLKQLQEHIDAYVNAYNDKAAPFVWTKKKVRQRRFKGRRITQL